MATAGAEVHLAVSAEDRVVLDVYRDVEPSLQLLTGGEAHPARQDRGRAHETGVDVERAGDSGHDRGRVVDPLGAAEFVEQPHGQVDRLGRPQIDVEDHVLLGEGAAEGVGERDVDVVVTEVDGSHGGLPRRGAEYGRGPATARAGALDFRFRLGDAPLGEEPGHGVVDRTARQTGQFHKLGAGHAAAGPDEPEDVLARPVPW